MDYVRDISKGTLLDSYSADEIAVYKRSNEMVQKDIRLLSIGYFLIVFYVHVILYKNNWGSCKIHLSFASIIGIALAIASAFGMAQVFGIKVRSAFENGRKLTRFLVQSNCANFAVSAFGFGR